MTGIRLPAWAWTALAVIALLLGAYAAGGRAARRSVESKQLQAKERAREKADVVAQEIDTLDDDSVRRRAELWVRSDNSR